MMDGESRPHGVRPHQQPGITGRMPVLQKGDSPSAARSAAPPRGALGQSLKMVEVLPGVSVGVDGDRVYVAGVLGARVGSARGLLVAVDFGEGKVGKWLTADADQARGVAQEMASACRVRTAGLGNVVAFPGRENGRTECGPTQDACAPERGV